VADSAKVSAPAPAPAPTMENAAVDILRRTWNWIVVGEEHRAQGVSVEYAVATTWLLRVGILFVVLGMGFFLKYSVERNLIGPVGRVSISILTGVAMLFAGIRMLGRQYHLFGQGLIGGGLAVLYFSFFAASTLYHLLTPVPAFAMMAVVTLGAGIIAVRFESVLIAIMGIVGGYLTPVLLSTGQANFVGLFSYELLLGLGILGIALYRDWILLNWLGFAGAYALFFAAMDRFYRVTEFWTVFPFLIAFFVLYSAVIYIFNLRNRRKSTLIELLGLMLNAGVFFATSYHLVNEAYGRRWVAAVTIALATFYMLQVLVFLHRRIADRALLLSLTALSGFFVTVTMPLLVSAEWLTVSWAVQAFFVLWVGRKLNSRFICQLAYLLYMILLWRLGFLDLSRQFHGGHAGGTPALAEYGHELVTRLMLFGIPIASLFGAYLLNRQSIAPAAMAVEEANDIRTGVPEGTAMGVFFWVGLLFAFLYLHLELNRTFLCVYAPVRLPVLTGLWAAMCAILATLYAQGRSRGVLALLTLFVTGMLFKLVVVDMSFWDVQIDWMRYGDRGLAYSSTAGLMRLLDFGLIVGLLSALAWKLRGGDEDRLPTRLFGVLGLMVLFVYLTLEVNTALGWFVPGFRAGGVSILWSAFALSLLIAGIRNGSMGLRLTALVLFTVVGWKILFSDLAHLDALYRIVAFLVLGVLVLAGSLLYLKNRQRFTVRTDAEGAARDQ